MRQSGLLCLLIVAGCDGAPKPPSSPSPPSIGALCGIPDLKAHVVAAPKPTFWIDEYRVGGSINNPPRPVPISARQTKVEYALPCIETEARRRGLAVVYPQLEVD